ncbi:DNA-binding MarR family transcriptional regulator [Agromyces terreus]|uniref:DNA-binding MarR family transcriptional regulator n=1 Tax=Agromyces terreus TaxID=424795 RepID=A0A9X2KA69_9MICO|nr:MarR family transcriptional regulator [Agromyces terreus]MCP2370058.1 DNA-binding MarR family transcriptional regulator [Agromyces terreus]
MTDRVIAVAAWESVFRAQVTVMRRLAEGFPSDLVSLNEYDVLFNIARTPERRLRLKDLNRSVLISQPSVSRMLDRLSARGLVAKAPDPDDGRGTIVSMTADGFALYRRVAYLHIEAIERNVGAGLDDDELVALTDLCRRLRLAIAEPLVGEDPAGA